MHFDSVYEKPAHESEAHQKERIEKNWPRQKDKLHLQANRMNNFISTQHRNKQINKKKQKHQNLNQIKLLICGLNGENMRRQPR